MRLHREFRELANKAALARQIREALITHRVNYDSTFGGDIVALDGDFIPTKDIADARWLYSENNIGYGIARINADGSITNITTKL